MPNKFEIKKELIEVISYSSINIFILLLSSFVNFLIPKYLNLNEYGEWRIFILYLGYAGFLHLGIVDNFYVNYLRITAQKKAESINLEFFALLKILFYNIILLLPLLLLLKPNLRIALFLLVNSIIFNLQTFFEVYFQVEKKFRDVNKVRLLKISLLFITFFSLQLFKFISLTNIYLIFTLSTLLTLIYSVWRSKVISLHVNISGINLSVLKEKIKIGMPYLMGNFIILLTVNVDKNFISVFSTKESFAIYGFASIFLIILKELINSLKSFIFPYLNSTYKDKREKIYNILSLYIIFGFSLTIVILPIIKYVILKYYPIYNLSIKLVPILFVATTFESLTIILHSNYYQTYNYYKNYLINSAFIGVIIYGIFFTCYALNPNLSLLNYAYMALFCGIMRVLFNDIYLRKKMNIRLINSLYMFIPFSALLINFLI